jgi:hypothetical protein
MRERAKAKRVVILGRNPKITHHQRQEAIARREADGPCRTSAGPMPSATPPSAALSRAGSVNLASFVLCGCPIVAKTAIPTNGAARMADIAIRFWDLMARSRDQKLFPHFGEAGTAVFAVEEVEDGRHDRTPSFDHHHAIIFLGVQEVI